MRIVALATKTDFRGIKIREVVLIEGEHGWGEFSPFLEYSPQECAPWLASAIEAASKPRPPLLRPKIAVNATLPAVTNSGDVAEILSWFPGCDVIKIKVGNNTGQDFKRINHALAITPDAKIRLDVNGLWSVEEARSFIEALQTRVGKDRIDYIEQPCGTLEELRELKSKLNGTVRISGDEVLRKARDPFSIDLVNAVDVLMLKVQPLGGLERSMALAAHHGLPVVVSSALESAIGISYGLHLAASLENLAGACGLATGALLADDFAALVIEGGAIVVSEVTPDYQGLEVSPVRYKWWQDRVMATWKHLA